MSKNEKSTINSGDNSSIIITKNSHNKKWTKNKILLSTTASIMVSGLAGTTSYLFAKNANNSAKLSVIEQKMEVWEFKNLLTQRDLLNSTISTYENTLLFLNAKLSEEAKKEIINKLKEFKLKLNNINERLAKFKNNMINKELKNNGTQ